MHEEEKRMTDARKSLQEQASELLDAAEKRGVSSNFFFVTTFKRYQIQMKILSKLEEEINNVGVLVTKEYVKDRPNLMENPAITAYNKTAAAANSTVGTLINIIRSLSGVDSTSGSFSKMNFEEDE